MRGFVLVVMLFLTSAANAVEPTLGPMLGLQVTPLPKETESQCSSNNESQYEVLPSPNFEESIPNDSDFDAMVRELIHLLGDEDWEKRTSAKSKLVKLLADPKTALRTAQLMWEALKNPVNLQQKYTLQALAPDLELTGLFSAIFAKVMGARANAKQAADALQDAYLKAQQALAGSPAPGGGLATSDTELKKKMEEELKKAGYCVSVRINRWPDQLWFHATFTIGGTAYEVTWSKKDGSALFVFVDAGSLHLIAGKDVSWAWIMWHAPTTVAFPIGLFTFYPDSGTSTLNVGSVDTLYRAKIDFALSNQEQVTSQGSLYYFR